jgi:hypothetical protein
VVTALRHLGLRLLEAGDIAAGATLAEALAGLWASVGQPERAARLFGAECARRPGQLVVRPGERYEEDLGAARSALGDAAFAAAWSEGQAMSLDEGVVYALEGEGGG